MSRLTSSVPVILNPYGLEFRQQIVDKDQSAADSVGEHGQ